MKIYLCGPIMDETCEVARDWRQRAHKALGSRFQILDPMRRNFKDREVDSANEIVEFDLQDVREADIVLVNYSKASIGTSMEVFYASHDLGKFVVAFSPFTFKDSNPWMVRFCTKILPSLDDAISYIVDHFISLTASEKKPSRCQGRLKPTAARPRSARRPRS
jgi:nucleoside 2-deoxyribosyltransferase